MYTLTWVLYYIFHTWNLVNSSALSSSLANMSLTTCWGRSVKLPRFKTSLPCSSTNSNTCEMQKILETNIENKTQICALRKVPMPQVEQTHLNLLLTNYCKDASLCYYRHSHTVLGNPRFIQARNDTGMNMCFRNVLYPPYHWITQVQMKRGGDGQMNIGITHKVREELSPQKLCSAIIKSVWLLKDKTLKVYLCFMVCHSVL